MSDRYVQRPGSQRNNQGTKEISPDIGQLKSRVDRLDRQVESLTKVLNEKNDWNTLVREWVNKNVTIVVASGKVEGKLLWTDRYTICIEGSPTAEVRPRKVVVHKGSIQMIFET